MFKKVVWWEGFKNFLVLGSLARPPPMNVQVQADAAFQRLRRFIMLQTEVRLLLIATDEVTDALEDLQLYNQRYQHGFAAMRTMLVHLNGHCNVIIATAQQDIADLYNQNAWWQN